MENFKLNDRIMVIGKKTSGRIVFIGETHFSEGEWFGIILDEATGRNNGSVDGQQYFKCQRNYGLFVRSCQLQKESIQSGSNPKTTCYPNYLKNSTSIKNKPDKKIKTCNKSDAGDKSLARPVHSMNTVIENLKNTLKRKCEEVFNLENQKKIAVEKTKIMKSEMQKQYEELKKSSMRENDLKLEIKTVKNNLVSLRRKLCKTDTCLQSSENKRSKMEMAVEKLRDITEHVIIEKEIAEESYEQLELLLKDEADKCKALETELDIKREEMKVQNFNGVPAVHYLKKIGDENEILKWVLLKLRGLYENLHQSFSSSKKALEKYAKENEELKNAEKAMEDTLAKYQEDTSELYDIIDSMSKVDDLVFEITEKSLESEEKINRLYEKIHDAENKLELSEEIKKVLQEIRFTRRDEIEGLESKIRHMQTALDQKKILIEERDEIFHKIRELTFSLRERNHMLSEDLESVNRKRKEAVLTTESLKLKMQREKRDATKDLIEKENIKFDLEGYKDELNYWMPFMPDTFFEQYGENAAVQVKLIASKMLKKLNLIIRLLQSHLCDGDKSDELKSLALYSPFLTSAYELHGCISLFIKSTDRIDPKQFLTLGKYHNILEKEYKEIDSYLNLFAKRDIDRGNCVNNIKNASSSLSRILNTKYATEGERTMIHLASYLNMIQCSCRCLLTYCAATGNNNNNSSEFQSDINLVAERATTIEASVKSILNIIQNYEKERICLIPAVEEKVKNDWKIIQEIMNSIIQIYETQNEEDTEFVISGVKRKENGILQEIICKYVAVDINLRDLYEKLSNNGEYFVEYTPDSVFSPVYSWAQRKRQEREQLISKLKCQVSTYNLKIVNLTESLQRAKAKLNKIQNLAKKDSSQQTDEREDRLTKHDAKVYITENCSTKLNSTQQMLEQGKQEYCTENWSAESNATQQMFEQMYSFEDCSKKAKYVSILYDMENTIKYLRQKNLELMIAPIKNQEEILKPLKVLPKPKYHRDTHNICVLQKRLNTLAVKLRSIILPNVVDITGNTKHYKEIKYNKYLAERILTKREIENELWNIAIEIKKLKFSSCNVWSDANSFIV